MRSLSLSTVNILLALATAPMLVAGCSGGTSDKVTSGDDDDDDDDTTPGDDDDDDDTTTDSVPQETGYNPYYFVLGIGAGDYTITDYTGVYSFILLGSGGGVCSITYDETVDNTQTIDASLCVNPDGVPCELAFPTARANGAEDTGSDCSVFGLDASALEGQQTSIGFVSSYPVEYSGQTYEYGPLKLFYYDGTYNGTVYQGWYVSFPAFYGSLFGPTYFGTPYTTLDATSLVWSDYFGGYYY